VDCWRVYLALGNGRFRSAISVHASPASRALRSSRGALALELAVRLLVRLGRLRLSHACPLRLLHTLHSLRPARHYPRFWIQRSSSERWRDLNPPDLGAAQRTLWPGVTSRARTSAATAPRLPAADQHRFASLAERETSRFPSKEHPHMPGSPTTPGRPGTRARAPIRVAFRDLKRVGTRDLTSFAAQWLACALPCRRFAVILAGANARLGAEVVRYDFLVEDLHPYSLPVSRRAQIKFELLQLIITYFVRTQQFR